MDLIHRVCLTPLLHSRGKLSTAWSYEYFWSGVHLEAGMCKLTCVNLKYCHALNLSVEFGLKLIGILRWPYGSVFMAAQDYEIYIDVSELDFIVLIRIPCQLQAVMTGTSFLAEQVSWRAWMLRRSISPALWLLCLIASDLPCLLHLCML